MGFDPGAVLSPVAVLLLLASGQTYFGLAIHPFLMEHLYYCDTFVIASFVGKVIPREGDGNCFVGEYYVSLPLAPRITQDNENFTRTPQARKNRGKTTEETSGCVRTERVNKWTISMIATRCC
jgi:hypothetical protein